MDFDRGKKIKFLVSGFESFLDIKENPTEALVRNLSELRFNNIDLSIEFKAMVLPVEFKRAFVELKNVIEDFKPDVVISMGVAQDRNQIELERVAINFWSSKYPDNVGFVPNNQSILAGGPDGVLSNLKVDLIVQDLNSKNINIKVSNTAGTYVCNSLMYELCLDSKKNNYLAGFVHVPNNLTQEILIESTTLILTSIFEVHF